MLDVLLAAKKLALARVAPNDVHVISDVAQAAVAPLLAIGAQVSQIQMHHSNVQVFNTLDHDIMVLD